MTTLAHDQRQLIAKIGAEGTFDETIVVAANADNTIFAPLINYEVALFERSPVRETLGAVKGLIGPRLGRLTFDLELRGSGTAGVAPVFAPLLKACGFLETINTGTAVIGAVSTNPLNLLPTSKPTVAGTFAGTKNGALVITITALVTDVSITFDAEFFPNPTSADYEQESGSQTSATAITLAGTQLTGVTVDFGDPSSSTTGFQIGDRFIVPLTSDLSVEVEYKTLSSSIPILDLALLQDGRIQKIHSAAGTFTGSANIGEPIILSMEFMGVPVDTVSSSDNSPGREDQALLTGIAYSANAPPIFQGITSNFFSSATPPHVNFSMDMGNVIANRQDPSKNMGYIGSRITGRNVTGSIDIEAQLFSEANQHDRLFDETTGALNMTVGSVAGNIVEVNFPRVQITNVDDSDRDALSLDALDLLMFEPEFDAGGAYEEMVIKIR